MATTKIHTFAGNIGIGTTDPGAFRLSVVGKADTTSLEINGVTNAEIKIGLIGLWYGSVASIPPGWALCNGQIVVRTDNGQNIATPNLVDRVVRCADGDSPSPAVPGQIDGANTLTLSNNQIPGHTHSITVSTTDAPHTHTGIDYQASHNHNTGFSGPNHFHSLQTNNCPHAHAIVVRGAELGDDHFVWAAENKRDLNAWGRQTGNQNAPHRHNIGNAGGNHSHPSNTSNAPHNHTTDAANAIHMHNTATAETGSGDSINIQNKYIYLAYIMKH